MPANSQGKGGRGGKTGSKTRTKADGKPRTGTRSGSKTATRKGSKAATKPKGLGLARYLAEFAPVPETPPHLWEEGRRVGEWRVGAFLARGGSSEAYCARHVRLGTQAVLKVLWREEEVPKARFARETAFLMENKAPAFPSFYGAGEEDGRPWMAMEPLEEYLPLPKMDAAVARYLTDVARGVAALHAKGWLHRDLKPGNILKRADGHAVLVDFGLLKPIEGTEMALDAESLSVVDGQAVGVGTPGYAAPEQFAGGPATPATDVHALGMLAEKCFDGNPPEAWDPIIRKATSSLPRLRYATVEEFLEAVEHRHDREAPPAREPDPVPEEEPEEEEKAKPERDPMDEPCIQFIFPGRKKKTPEELEEERRQQETQKWRVGATMAVWLAALAGLGAAFWFVGHGVDAALARDGTVGGWCWWHLRFVVGPGLLAAFALFVVQAVVSDALCDKRTGASAADETRAKNWAEGISLAGMLLAIGCAGWAVWHAFALLGLSWRAFGVSLLYLAEFLSSPCAPRGLGSWAGPSCGTGAWIDALGFRQTSQRKHAKCHNENPPNVTMDPRNGTAFNGLEASVFPSTPEKSGTFPPAMCLSSTP